MSIQDQIESQLNQVFHPQHMEVVNESNMHSVPPGSETHFKVVLVTDLFQGKGLVARHRMINHTLEDLLKKNVHALALHTYTSQEWENRQGKSVNSPPCEGGS